MPEALGAKTTACLRAGFSFGSNLAVLAATWQELFPVEGINNDSNTPGSGLVLKLAAGESTGLYWILSKIRGKDIPHLFVFHCTGPGVALTASMFGTVARQRACRQVGPHQSKVPFAKLQHVLDTAALFAL